MGAVWGRLGRNEDWGFAEETLGDKRFTGKRLGTSVLTGKRLGASVLRFESRAIVLNRLPMAGLLERGVVSILLYDQKISYSSSELLHG